MSSTTADLRARLGAAHGTKLRVRGVELGQKHFVEATHERRIDLTGLASYLKGVSASGSEPVLVAPVRGAMAIMSSMPDANATHGGVAPLSPHRQRRSRLRTAWSSSAANSCCSACDLPAAVAIGADSRKTLLLQIAEKRLRTSCLPLPFAVAGSSTCVTPGFSGPFDSCTCPWRFNAARNTAASLRSAAVPAVDFRLGLVVTA
jgi:hypothetical protein